MEEERRFNAWAKETFGAGNPTPDSIALIERNHQCKECGGAVRYVRKPDTADAYHFVCNECGNEDDNAPLKKRDNK